MIIKPYKNDLWFRMPSRRVNPDIEDKYFAQKGEFSPWSDMAFQKHINKLDKLNSNPTFQDLNGERIKRIREFENFWY